MVSLRKNAPTSSRIDHTRMLNSGDGYIDVHGKQWSVLSVDRVGLVVGTGAAEAYTLHHTALPGMARALRKTR